MKKINAFLYKSHKIFGIIFCIPLFLTALTSILSVIFVKLGNEKLAKFMLEINTMRILGIENVYCSILGMGLLWILITGFLLSGILSVKSKDKI